MAVPNNPMPIPVAKQRSLLAPGARVEQYEIIRPIGSGGMGEVFLARDLKLGRLVALKFLYPESPEVVTRVLVEARATAKCTHENIVVIHDMNEFQGMPYLVLEYLDGKSLRKLHNDSKLPVVRAVEVMCSVVRALAHAHAAGIIHRDLKPDNIFITTAGIVKVLDFGIAKLHGVPSIDKLAAMPNLPANDDETYVTISGQGGPVGTWRYMSPEQWSQADVDHRTDIWAVGVILFKLVTGRYPFEQPDAVSMMYAVVSDDEPTPSVASVVPDVHPYLAQIIDRCLCKHRDMRFATAGELLVALEALIPNRRSGTIEDRSPYPGLASFQEADAERFFGRTDQIARVLDRLQTQPLLAIVGPSGVGKSSFVRAGVVPALKRDEPWDSIVMRPGRAPLIALASAITPQQQGDDAALRDYARAVAQRMYEEPGYLGQVLRWHASRNNCKVLLYVDQFEELYTLVPDPAQRAAFVASLRGAADDPSSPVRVVLSMRSDFLDRPAEDREFMPVFTSGMHYLVPLGRGGLWNALVKPADQVGHSFESADLVGRMVDEMASATNALPLLQFAASKMWESRDRARRMLTEQSFMDMGGIAGALAQHADAVLAELPPDRRKLAQAVFQRLVTSEGTRAIVDLDELIALSPEAYGVRQLVDHLVGARLLVSKADDVGANATVELVHESLIVSWPQLRQWAEAGKEENAFLVALRQAAQQWDQRGRPQGLLWRGEAADDARRNWERLGHTVAQRERDFLMAVIGLANRAGRLKSLAVTAIMIVLAALVVVGIVVVIKVRTAEQKAIKEADEANKARAQIEAKDKAREEAETAKAKAEKDKAAVTKDLDKSQSDLQAAYEKLQLEKKAAEDAAAEARSARDKADKLAAQIKVQYDAEKKRADEAEKRSKGYAHKLE